MKLRLKSTPSGNVDMSPLTPAFCQDQSIEQVKACKLQCDSQAVSVDELFEVTDNDSHDLEISGACEKLDYVGAQMDSGTLLISGDVGHYAAGHCAGGTIEVRGNVGNFCGHSMTGGRIVVRGNAEDFCGGALPGDMQGMAGGEIFILGNVGEHCGDHMRRGLIGIRGDAGPHCGSRIKAGTIILSGRCGAYCGYGMRRGSIILRELPEQSFGASFILQDENFETHFLVLLSNYLQGIDNGFGPLPLPKSAVRYVGDLAADGQGEILIIDY